MLVRRRAQGLFADYAPEALMVKHEAFNLVKRVQVPTGVPFFDVDSRFGTVAQLVEHEPFKLVVAGSSPARLTILKPLQIKAIRPFCRGFFVYMTKTPKLTITAHYRPKVCQYFVNGFSASQYWFK